MPSWLRWFFLGIVTAFAGLGAGAYLFVRAGGVPMETSAKPLPLERTVAGLALRASLGNAAAEKNPLPVNDANMLAGVDQYQTHCAVCHGIPGRPPTAISKGEFPPPPQLFEKGDMVAGDPEGILYWKVTHGIRLSGMPGFGDALSNTQRWQVTMLVASADRLSPTVHAALATAASDAGKASR
jgi:mono/diheme cytochrome c family protein